MFVVTLRRQKCVGCHYCQEVAPDFFRLSRKDGKSVLLQSEHKRDVWVRREQVGSIPPGVEQAYKGCPVHIIEAREI